MSDEKLTIDEMTETELDEYEGDIVNALLEASNYLTDNSEYRKISIPRRGKIMFSFRVHPLNDDELVKCRRQNLKNRGKRNEELNSSRYASQVIYTATLDEDRAKLWDNKGAWDKLNVASGVDVVNAVLKSGEKLRVLEIINELSGYGDELDDFIKNA